MSKFGRQFVAVLLTIWLPLFSGNALAVSIAMQWTAGGCQTGMAQPGNAHGQEAGHMMRVAQPDQIAGDCGMSMDTAGQDGAVCASCDVCHLAGSGYLAAVTVEMATPPRLASAYPAYTPRFQSVTLTPLDPPPLARA